MFPIILDYQDVLGLWKVMLPLSNIRFFPVVSYRGPLVAI